MPGTVTRADRRALAVNRRDRYDRHMNLEELLSKATDGITVRRVSGEPITAGDSLLIPVA